ncbi:MAG TPA: serine hydrolase [Solirubrobacterales bacterium]|nr:serine hydrolase [Solirubrobacterales bacterium]
MSSRGPFAAWLLASLAILALAPAASSAAPPTWSSRIAAARRYASGREGAVAFAVVGERGRLHGFHARETAPAASVFKVMLLAALLRKRHDSGLSPTDRALLGPMIRRSDSVAATTVRNIVGRRRIERLARVAGMRDFHYEWVWGESRTSPRDEAEFMYRLRSYIPGRYRHYAMGLLARIVPSQRWGVGRVAPPGWRLFFKGGWGSGSGRVDHQVALLERGHRKLAIAVFTQFDPDHAYGKRTLRGVFARLLRGLALSPDEGKRG